MEAVKRIIISVEGLYIEEALVQRKAAGISILDLSWGLSTRHQKYFENGN